MLLRLLLVLTLLPGFQGPEPKPGPSVQELLSIIERGTGSWEETEQIAMRAVEKALQTDDRPGAAIARVYLGQALYARGKNSEAIEVFQVALKLTADLKMPKLGGVIDHEIGLVLSDDKKYGEAIQHFQSALTAARKFEGDKAVAVVLFDLGAAIARSGGAAEQTKALPYFTEAANLSQKASDTAGEARCRMWIAVILDNVGRWQEAPKAYDTALTLSLKAGDQELIAGCLDKYANLAATLRDLGRPFEAISCLESAWSFAKKAKGGESEQVIANNLAQLYVSVGRLDDGAKIFEELLSRPADGKMANLDAACENNLGWIYEKKEQPREALAHYQRAVQLLSDSADIALLARSIINLAGMHRDSDEDVTEAAKLFLEAAVLSHVAGAGEKESEAAALLSLGGLYYQEEAPFGIWLAKRAVDLSQSIRQDWNKTDQTYARALSDKLYLNYRGLAAALLRDGRLAEMFEVMALAKGSDTTAKLLVRPLEAKLNGMFDKLLEEATKLMGSSKPADFRTIASAVWKDFEPMRKVAADWDSFDEEKAETPSFTKFSKMFHLSGNANSTTAALMFLMPGSECAYMFATGKETEASVLRVGSHEAETLVSDFLAVLRDPTKDPRPKGLELYKKFIEPIERRAAERGIKIETLLCSLDGPLRQVPIAALWDGERFLIEKYAISYFSPAAVDLLEAPASNNWSALVAGVKQGASVADPVTGDLLTLSTLSAVPAEVDTVAGLFPGKKLLDSGFSPQTFVEALKSHPQLVHIASHFAFNKGDDRRSFLLTGGGEPWTVEEIKKLPEDAFKGVALVTLSACSTAIGESADGSEAESFAAWIQRKGAQAVLSTLWPVADATTGAVMSQFYTLKKANPSWTKTQCIREAQLALLNGKLDVSKALGGRTITSNEPTGKRLELRKGAPYSHPYYWAPFVLSGNFK
jgi:CHAT domain-containing protein/tetratricopeptide (TPR) repeat protein